MCALLWPLDPFHQLGTFGHVFHVVFEVNVPLSEPEVRCNVPIMNGIEWKEMEVCVVKESLFKNAESVHILRFPCRVHLKERLLLLESLCQHGHPRAMGASVFG